MALLPDPRNDKRAADDHTESHWLLKSIARIGSPFGAKQRQNQNNQRCLFYHARNTVTKRTGIQSLMLSVPAPLHNPTQDE